MGETARKERRKVTLGEFRYSAVIGEVKEGDGVDGFHGEMVFADSVINLDDTAGVAGDNEVGMGGLDMLHFSLQ